MIYLSDLFLIQFRDVLELYKLARADMPSMAWVNVCSFHRLRSSLSWEKW